MKKKLILIGASTGGPSQIKKILSNITSLSSIVVIVQHMKEEVLPFFIKDLQNSVNAKVLATPLKTSLNEPCIIVCSQSCVLVKKGYGYEIQTDTTQQKYTPDINKLFNSFASLGNDFDIKVLIMTGIGADGVDGAKQLKQNGAYIISQDEKSCAVYGMPRVAKESGIVDEVKTLIQITTWFKGQ